MKFARTVACVAGALVLAGASATGLAAARQNWTAHVAVGDDGTHVLGNPDAKVKLSEYVSYTCSHCATFQRESDAPLRLAYVMPGKVSLRVVHLVRDPIDMTAAMLTNCGDPKGFFARHNAFLASQDKWIGKAQTATAAQRARWTSGDMPARMRAIAGDFGFYDLMAHRGLGRATVDRCLADDALANRIAGQRSESERLGVPGTPSFAISENLLESVHDWKSLSAAIDSAL